MECPVCKKEFDEKTGRRPKKFCSDECKVKFWNSQKKIKKEPEPALKFAKAIKDRPLESDISYQKPGKSAYDAPKSLSMAIMDEAGQCAAPENDNAFVLEQINALKKQKVPEDRNTFWGKKAWQKEQSEKIAALKELLK